MVFWLFFYMLSTISKKNIFSDIWIDFLYSVILMGLTVRTYFMFVMGKITEKANKYVKNNNCHDAILFLDEVIKEQPDNLEFLSNRAIIYAYQGSFKDFNIQYNKIFNDKSKNSNWFYYIHCTKLFICLAKNNLQEGDIYLLRRHKIFSSNKKVYTFPKTCGQCIERYYERDYEKSFQLATQLNSSSLWFYKFFCSYIMYSCKLNLGDIHQAEEYMEKLIQLPENEESKIILERFNVKDAVVP